MKKIAAIYLAIVFGCAAYTGIANATSIKIFDAAPLAAKNALVNMNLQTLATATAKQNGANAAKCVIAEFTKFDPSTGAAAPHGLNLLSAQLQLQRQTGKADITQVEDVVLAVFAAILQDVCS